MKLARVGPHGAERPAIISDDGSLRDISAFVTDIAGDALGRDGLRKLGNLDLATLPELPADVRIGPCVGGVSKFVCVGLNYAEHARESGAPVPEEPILFMKATSSICGPHDDIIIPKGASRTDWEVELGVVIGEQCSYVSEEDAPDYIAGYCVVNDVSERAFQFEGTGQWLKGKSADTFGPIGPWLVTADEVADPQSLDLWLKVNGKTYQNSNTADMIYGISMLVSYISRFMTLLPGDIISTGTPLGVGMALKPPVYLAPRDRMELGIQGLGQQAQNVRAWSPNPERSDTSRDRYPRDFTR